MLFDYDDNVQEQIGMLNQLSKQKFVNNTHLRVHKAKKKRKIVRMQERVDMN